jgi:hypothetical protein
VHYVGQRNSKIYIKKEIKCNLERKKKKKNPTMYLPTAFVADHSSAKLKFACFAIVQVI